MNHVTFTGRPLSGIRPFLFPPPSTSLNQNPPRTPESPPSFNIVNPMDSSSVSDAGGNASYGTLASLFGVKGPWRLVPQGSTPKAHIIIKRDNYREQSTSGESSSGVARFSFIAGKKFTISKGQPLLFALASPNDQDGKTLLYDDTTFLLEADLAPSEESIEEHTELPANDIAQQMSGRKNIASLPPKMRKSYAKQKSYASFVESKLSPYFI